MCLYVTLSLTDSSKAGLSARHESVSSRPAIISHCAPLVVDAHLYTTCPSIGSISQSDTTTNTITGIGSCGEKKQKLIKYCVKIVLSSLQRCIEHHH